MKPLSPLQMVLAAIALDLAVLAAVTVLGALHVIPGEAVIGLLGTILGARAMSRMGGGGPGGGASAGSSYPPPARLPDGKPLARISIAEISTVAALALLVAGWLLPHHHHPGSHA